jgi:Leucine-rich repeat (LRR) protein
LLESKTREFKKRELIDFLLNQNFAKTFLTQKDLGEIRLTSKESLELVFQGGYLFNLKSAKDNGDFDKLQKFISKLNYKITHTLSLPKYINDDQLKSILKQKLAKGDLTVGESVTNLDLADCRNLTDKASEYLLPLANIKSLDISKCDKLVKAKFSTNIVSLDISHCRKLKGNNLAEMTSVENIIASGSVALINFKAPINVKLLDLSLNSKSEYDIQEMINKCQNLEYLNISGRNVEKELKLPNTVMSLDISQCKKLSHSNIQNMISQCPNIKYLNLSGCELERNLELSKNESIKSLDLSGCNQLNHDQIQRMIDQCPNLESLNLSGCKLERNLVLPSKIKSLTISNCKKLNHHQIQEMITDCPNLENLDISNCQITEFTFYKSVNFKKLTILSCETLKTLTFLEGANIDFFNINHCKQLEAINIGKNIKINKSDLTSSEELKKMLKGIPRSTIITIATEDPSPSLQHAKTAERAQGR